MNLKNILRLSSNKAKTVKNIAAKIVKQKTFWVR